MNQYKKKIEFLEKELEEAYRSVTILTNDLEKTNETLLESEERYRDLVETSQDLIFRCDIEGRFTYLNKAWNYTHGYKVKEMLGLKFTEFQTQEVAKRDMNEFARELKGFRTNRYETTHISKSGRVIYLSFNVLPIYNKEGQIIGTQGTAYDITKRKLAEEKLINSEKRLDSIINTVPDIVYRLDHEGKFTFISHAVERYGYTCNELIGKRIFTIVHPEDRKKAKYHINERRTGDRKTKSLEVRLISKDKKIYECEIRAQGIDEYPVFLIDAEGFYDSEKPDVKSFSGTQGIARDISDYKRAQKALEKSEEKYRFL